MSRLTRDNDNTGSLADVVSFSKPTGWSLPLADGGTSGECSGTVRSAAHGDIVRIPDEDPL